MVANSLRVLCLDGGGVKGYTSLLILKRIFRTMVSDGTLAEEPRPCDVFDLIAGTSTGGIIAVMLGRLRMTIDECLREYEKTGEAVFGKNISSSKLGKMLKAGSGSAFYDINILQERIRKVVSSRGFDAEQSFKEENTTCKVSLPDLLRNYITVHPTQENYECAIWEAASATAAAPLYFKPVVLSKTGERFGDGGVRRNNPVNEAINETNRLKEKEWAGREIGCLVSIGTGAIEAHNLSNSIPELLKGAVAIMTDSEDIADQFVISELGQSLEKSKRYFRFNVPQGLQMLQMDEWKETEKMKASTTDYLRKYQSGNVIKVCAQSLLDPDVNLNTNTLSKPSLLPNRPCVHFVHRMDNIVQIQSFFHPFIGGSMIFVLSGMAGVGKTQIALKFAELSMPSLSVFWVRADNWANFAKDYSQILRIAFSAESETQNPSDRILMRTKEMLESKPSEWVLILDNADDLQEFRDNIQRYIPRKGRILVTTRDRRFQGSVAAAGDGCHIMPMNDKEALDLLWKSVPIGLVDPVTWEENAMLIASLVGNLPLAIAQAAANIVEQDMPLSQFAIFLNKQSEISAQLKEPVRDFMSSDERNNVQSVTTTWTMSFELLEKSNPSSIALLGYLTCFSNCLIPYNLLRQLPELSDIDEADFVRHFGKLHQLYLAERVIVNSNMAAQLHPLVYEIAWKTICAAEPQRWLEPIVNLICSHFPIVDDENEPEWETCVYFAPHALRAVVLGQECSFMTKPFARLMQCLSNYMTTFGEHKLSCALASTALDLAIDIWGPEDHNTFLVLKVKIKCFDASSSNQEAMKLLQDALSYLGSHAAKSSLSQFAILKERYLLTYRMSEILHREENYSIMAERERDLLNILHEGKQAYIGQFLEGQQVPAESSELSAFLRLLKPLALSNDKRRTIEHLSKFRLAFALAHSGEIEEPLHLVESILTELAPEGIDEEYTVELKRVFELRDFLLGGHAAPFDHRLTAFKESLLSVGIKSENTWYRANDVLQSFSQYPKEATETWTALLDAAVKPGVQLPRRSELGRFLNALALNMERAEHWIAYLNGEGNVEAAKEFSQKLERVRNDFARGIDIPVRDRKRYDILNTYAVALQKQGKLKDAEEAHRTAIAQAEAEGDSQIAGVLYYNLMLAIARQGRLEEARTYRNQHLGLVSKVEYAQGALEARMARDHDEKAIYEEAAARLALGDSYNNGLWWEENVEALHRAELRYGRLEQLQQLGTRRSTVEEEIKETNKDTFRLGQRLKRLRQNTMSILATTHDAD